MRLRHKRQVTAYSTPDVSSNNNVDRRPNIQYQYYNTSNALHRHQYRAPAKDTAENEQVRTNDARSRGHSDEHPHSVSTSPVYDRSCLQELCHDVTSDGYDFFHV